MRPAIAPEFRVVLLGDQGVGKTTFIGQCDSTNQHYPMTMSIFIGDVLITRTVVFHELSSTLHPYEDYATCPLGGSLDGAILMFDVTRPEIYAHLEAWYEVLAYLARKELPIVLCGNKTDLVDARRVHQHHITFPLAEGIPYFETSQTALYGLNVPVWRLLADAHSDRALNPAHKMLCGSYLAEIEARHEASVYEYEQYKWERAQVFEMLNSPGCRLYETSPEVRIGLDSLLNDESILRAYFPFIYHKCVWFILRPSQEAGEELLQMHVRFGEDVAALRQSGMHLRLLVTAFMEPLYNDEAWVECAEGIVWPSSAWPA